VTSDHGQRPDLLAGLDVLSDGHIGIDR